jgi:hypothetical protein
VRAASSDETEFGGRRRERSGEESAAGAAAVRVQDGFGESEIGCRRGGRRIRNPIFIRERMLGAVHCTVQSTLTCGTGITHQRACCFIRLATTHAGVKCIPAFSNGP